MSTITLTEDYGYDDYRVDGLPDGSTIDASGASWVHDNDSSDGQSNPYPFAVYNADNVTLKGGTINGNIDQDAAWRTVYDAGNAAAIRTEDTPNVVISDWRITDTWDAVRVSWNSPDFLIENIWATNVRDDAIENDRLQSGTIRDSLIDGAFGGLSIDPSSSSPVDGHNETVLIDGVLLRLQLSSYKGEMTHSSLIKTDSATDGAVTPSLRFVNNVFAIEDVEHRSYRSMFDAWDHTIESRNNVFLNLSDDPLPDDYPMPPEGWQVLQGQEARDYWENARDEWIAEHGDGAGDIQEGTEGDEPVAGDDQPDVSEDQNTDATPDVDAGETPDTTPDADDADTGETSEAKPDEGEADDSPDVAPESEPESSQDDDTAVDDTLENNEGSDGQDDPQVSVDGEIIYGDDGGGKVYGTDGADIIYGGDGGDDKTYIHGDGGNDIIYGGADRDKLYGDAGDDIIHGVAGENELFGGDGADVIYGGSDRDKIYGDDGDDIINGGAGRDRLYGGDGADTFQFDADALDGNRNKIKDFSVDEGDKVDLSLIADAYGLGAEEMLDAVKIWDNDSGMRIGIDVEGDFHTLVVLSDVVSQDFVEADSFIF